MSRYTPSLSLGPGMRRFRMWVLCLLICQAPASYFTPTLPTGGTARAVAIYPARVRCAFNHTWDPPKHDN